MIDRYTHPEMGNIWTLENEFRTMLKVEILACEAMNKLGIVPDEALKDIQTKADFRLDRIKEIEAVTNHDVIAFLTNVAEYVGDASKYIHKGLTSSDVKDTALCYMTVQSASYRKLYEHFLLILGKIFGFSLQFSCKFFYTYQKKSLSGE